MPASASDEQGLLPRRNQVSDMRMPEVVEPDAGHLTARHPAVEDLGDTLGVKRLTIWLGKYQPVVPIAATDRQTILGLPSFLALH